MELLRSSYEKVPSATKVVYQLQGFKDAEVEAIKRRHAVLQKLLQLPRPPQQVCNDRAFTRVTSPKGAKTQIFLNIWPLARPNMAKRKPLLA